MFWRRIMSVKDIFWAGLRFKRGSGERVSLWKDNGYKKTK